MSDVQIVFDIGGTNTRVATVQDGALGPVTKFPTPADPDEGIRVVVAHIRSLLGGDALERVCGGVAGSVVGGVIAGANNLLLWNGAFIVEDLTRELGVSVSVMNDAELAGIGEYTYGAGKGYSTLLYVTISTGIGKARIADGKVVNEEDPLKVSAELVDLLDLEHSISGTAVRNLHGIDPKDMTGAIRTELAEHLARGLKSSTDNFSQQAIILGGSMVLGKNPIPLEPVQSAFPNVAVKKAALGDNSGLYGAMAYLKSQP